MAKRRRKRRSAAEEKALKEMWTKYKMGGEEKLRNRLMEVYLPLVKFTAERIWAKLPSEVELDDLSSAGIFGLMDAIEAFDLSRGVKFETYCTPRIRGAILDELRAMDWVPRLVRTRAHKLDDACKRFEAAHSRPPTDSELARELGVSMEEYAELARSALTTTMTSLFRNWEEADGEKSMRELDVVEDKTAELPEDDIQRRDLRQLITKGLSQKERLIMLLYYYEEMTMKEIGRTLDLSESRVSQMHSSIVVRLAAQLRGRQPEFSH